MLIECCPTRLSVSVTLGLASAAVLVVLFLSVLEYKLRCRRRGGCHVNTLWWSGGNTFRVLNRSNPSLSSARAMGLAIMGDRWSDS